MKHYDKLGDLLAIPFFLLGAIYFYTIDNKNILEYILFIFCILGFVLDTLFTIQNIRANKL
jgi:hypothetical protein